MDRELVESSMIKSIGYDPLEEVLEVEFNRGGVYQYLGVPEDVYTTVAESDSVGKSFSSLVKSKGYKYHRM
jgi:hypothetical protein